MPTVDQTIHYMHGKRTIVLQKHQYFVDRYTEVGEPADVYRVYPNGGRTYIPWSRILRFCGKEQK